MFKFKKLLITGLAVIAAGALSTTALAAADFGSSAAAADTSYTLEDMLTYAIQDETLAYAEYSKILETYGIIRPFSNIIRAEQSHIDAIERLFEAYTIALPDTNAGAYVTVPASVAEALEAGIQAEKNNIAMYEKFLAQALPDDVKTVFTALMNASETHLAAFERALAGGSGGGNGYGGNGSSGRQNGTGSVNAGAGTGVCIY